MSTHTGLTVLSLALALPLALLAPRAMGPEPGSSVGDNCVVDIRPASQTIEMYLEHQMVTRSGQRAWLFQLKPALDGAGAPLRKVKIGNQDGQDVTDAIGAAGAVVVVARSGAGTSLEAKVYLGAEAPANLKKTYTLPLKRVGTGAGSHSPSPRVAHPTSGTSRVMVDLSAIETWFTLVDA